tara:strand:+ start:978 stop:1259 length:282 start_codon:yes stop_codon:yes gene_type:complete
MYCLLTPKGTSLSSWRSKDFVFGTRQGKNTFGNYVHLRWYTKGNWWAVAPTKSKLKLRWERDPEIVERTRVIKEGDEERENRKKKEKGTEERE